MGFSGVIRVFVALVCLEAYACKNEVLFCPLYMPVLIIITHNVVVGGCSNGRES